LLQQAPELTALVAYNDLVAIGALHACAERGLEVPVDCAIVGCDDVLLAALVSPALTTIHIPTYDLGQQAMGLLLNMIEPGVPPTNEQPGQPPTPIVVSPHLVLRHSVDKPSQRKRAAKRSETILQRSPL
jgi:DNA-binding LacI/PurR family transcriptional regulator